MAILMGVISISPVVAQTPGFHVIYFTWLTEGAIVSELSCDSGVSCPEAAPDVTIEVRAQNEIPDNSGLNTAMIFDAECLPGGTASDCSGEDPDLFFPGHGKTMINSEDLDSDDPDDQDFTNSFMEFDFNNIPGGVTIHSIDVGDIEDREAIDAFVEFHHGDCPGHPIPIDDDIQFPLPVTGDNEIETVDLTNMPGFSGLHIRSQFPYLHNP